jgi:hypothetical protein
MDLFVKHTYFDLAYVVHDSCLTIVIYHLGFVRCHDLCGRSGFSSLMWINTQLYVSFFPPGKIRARNPLAKVEKMGFGHNRFYQLWGDPLFFSHWCTTLQVWRCLHGFVSKMDSPPKKNWLMVIFRLKSLKHQMWKSSFWEHLTIVRPEQTLKKEL